MASSANFFGFEQIEADSGVDPTLIFEEINKELEEYLLEKSINTDSTNGVFDLLETLNNQVQENFDELIGEDTNKKRFITALARILALLLTLKSTQWTKSKEYLKLQQILHRKYGKDKSN